MADRGGHGDKGSQEIKMSKSRTKKLSPLLHVSEAGFSGRQAVGIALGDKYTVRELLRSAARCA